MSKHIFVYISIYPVNLVYILAAGLASTSLERFSIDWVLSVEDTVYTVSCANRTLTGGCVHSPHTTYQQLYTQHQQQHPLNIYIALYTLQSFFFATSRIFGCDMLRGFFSKFNFVQRRERAESLIYSLSLSLYLHSAVVTWSQVCSPRLIMNMDPYPRINSVLQNGVIVRHEME